MPRTLTSRFGSEAEAERALSAISEEVPLRDSAVISSGLAGSLTLDSLNLTPEERAMCEEQVSKGGFLLIAQVASESRGEAVLRLLDDFRGGAEAHVPVDTRIDREPPIPATPPIEREPHVPALPNDELQRPAGDGPRIARQFQAPPAPASEDLRVSAPQEPAPRSDAPLNASSEEARQPATPEAQAPAPAPAPIASPPQGRSTAEEERIPLIEEELRIGKREVVRGRSRVHVHVAEIPVDEQVELLEEETHIERRPVNRRLSEEEVAQGGLLQERVVEITEMREEAVVTKEAFVREEVVVTKVVQRRVEQIHETLRRTEVETERLQVPEDASPPR
jgi:uncharacterized protein (TIGR02271 family)